MTYQIPTRTSYVLWSSNGGRVHRHKRLLILRVNGHISRGAQKRHKIVPRKFHYVENPIWDETNNVTENYVSEISHGLSITYSSPLESELLSVSSVATPEKDMPKSYAVAATCEGGSGLEIY